MHPDWFMFIVVLGTIVMVAMMVVPKTKRTATHSLPPNKCFTCGEHLGDFDSVCPMCGDDSDRSLGISQ